MQIERAVFGVYTLGPGIRLGVWVNGCKRRCKGCVSQRLQAFDPRNEVDIEEYFDGFDLTMADGVTVSGGEPFEQPEELYRLVGYFRKRGIHDILIYTGYTIEELRAKNNADINGTLELIDVLIDGPYMIEQDSGKGNLKGSDNQRVLFLNGDLREKYAAFYRDEREMQEFYLGNTVLAVGIPDAEYIKNFERNE